MTTALTITCLAGAMVWAIAQLFLNFSVADRSRVRHAVSDYGVGRSAGLFRLAGVANLASLLALAAALSRVAGGSWWQLPAVQLLLVAAAGRVGVLRFPTDLPGERRTSHGVLHLAFAIAQFAALYTFLGNHGVALAASSQVGWLPELQRGLVVLAGASLAGVVLGFVPAARRWFGLVERVFLVSSTCAVAVCAIALLTR